MYILQSHSHSLPFLHTHMGTVSHSLSLFYPTLAHPLTLVHTHLRKHLPARATKYGGSSPMAVPAPHMSAGNCTAMIMLSSVTGEWPPASQGYVDLDYCEWVEDMQICIIVSGWGYAGLDYCEFVAVGFCCRHCESITRGHGYERIEW